MHGQTVGGPKSCMASQLEAKNPDFWLQKVIVDAKVAEIYQNSYKNHIKYA